MRTTIRSRGGFFLNRVGICLIVLALAVGMVGYMPYNLGLADAAEGSATAHGERASNYDTGTLVDLIAGQHIVAGHVHVSNDGEHLSVTYATADGWMLMETHLAVSADEPGGEEWLEYGWQNPAGNPVPGQFPHKAVHDPTVDDKFTYVIPLGEITDGVGPDDQIFLGARAVVYHADEGKEGAWGDGERFVERGNWAMFFGHFVLVTHTLTVAITEGGSVTEPGEGAFIHLAGTVVDLVANADEGYQFVNWTGDVGTVADVDAVSTTITMNGSYEITANFVDEEAEPDATTYTTVEEQSELVGSQGGQIQLNDGAGVTMPPDTFDEGVSFSFSRRSAVGELPTSIEEDPDAWLISDFYFLETDMVLDRQRGITLEIPYEPSIPADQVRVIRSTNVEGKTYVHFVDALVDEASETVIVSDAVYFPGRAAIQEHEEAFPPTQGFGFHGMNISIGYAAVSDTHESNPALCACSRQIQTDEPAIVCVTRWFRITCYGSRADVVVDRTYGTSDEMVDYAITALRYADSIQRAYTEAGLDTWDKITVSVSPLAGRGDGQTIPGFPGFFVKRGLDIRNGHRLNYVINHETVHTMQGTFQAGWWLESSADWIAYYFEPDQQARERLGAGNVFQKYDALGNPYREPFPWSGAEYDYDVLIDFAVEAGHWVAGDVVGFINSNYTPATELTHLYREQPHAFARHIGDRGTIIPDLEYLTAPGHQLDFRHSGSVELSIEVEPLTLPFMYFEPESGGLATFSVYVLEADSGGGVVVYSRAEVGYQYEGTRYCAERLRTEPAVRLYLFPYAQGADSARLKLLIEWWPAVEYDLTVSSTEGGRVTAPGEGTFTYWAGDIERLIAEPNDGYQFVDWTGDVETVSHLDEAVSTITIEGNHSIRANFAKLPPDAHTLTISSTTAGEVTIPGEGTFSYEEGAVVDLVAEAYEGSVFTGWTGDVDTIADVSDPSTTITMNGDYTITASFDSPPSWGEDLWLMITSTEGGSVTTPGEGIFWYDLSEPTWEPEVVDLVATPDSGYRFVNWTGDVGTIADVSSASTTITMDANNSIMANFEEVPTGQYTLTISSRDAGFVTTPGEGTFTYDSGAVVDLVAEVDWCSWLFYQWTGDVDTLDDVYDAATTIIMNGDYSISASFDHPGSVGIFPWVSVWICSTDGGSVTTPYEGEVQTEIGAVEDLVATPDSGYRFVNWTGTVETVADVNAASTTITMDSTYYITAVFEEEGEEEPEYLPMVAAGHRHILGLMFDGTVVALGNNEYGQCDVGTWTDIIQVAAGSYHTVGLKSDGTVVAVGWNHHGQCDVDIWTDIIQVTAGGGHTAGLKSDGTVVATGNNNVGQCDVGGWTDIMQVVAGHSHTVGLKSDGTVVAIGYTASELNASGWTDIVQLSAGLEHTVGLKSNGTVVAVGRNSWGQCDVDTWTDIVQIAAGRSSTVGLMCDGTVIAAGSEYVGTRDVGDWTEITQVAAGGTHIVGLKSDGTVVAVGGVFSGQCDVGTWTDIIQVSAGSGHTLGLKSDGTVVAVGSNARGQCDVDTWTDIVGIAAGYSHTVAVRSDGTAVAAGPDHAWHVEDWTDIIQVAGGLTHTVGLKSDGTVVAAGVDADDWGDWLGGEWPIIEEWTDIVQVAAGEDHAVGLKSNGAVLAAGSNLHGECNVQDWTDIVKLAAGGLEIDDVPNGATRGHTVGLRSNGTVVAVGYDVYGQLDVADWTDITDIAAGHWHTVGLKSDGTVVATGYDSYGQCNVDGWMDIIQVAAGGWCTLGLKGDGTVVAAGAEVELAKWNLLETASPPTEIWDWYGLNAIRDNLSGDYVLVTNLDSTTAGYAKLAGPDANDGKGWEPIGTDDDPFVGSFDGQGYGIRHLFIHRPEEDGVGLFGQLGHLDLWGTIENVGVADAAVTGRDRVGGLVGRNHHGTVSNSYSTGSVMGSESVGGLAGSAVGLVSDSHFSGTVTGVALVGGLIGVFWSGGVRDSHSTGSVTGSDEVGGLIGYLAPWAVVHDSNANCSVTGERHVGGLIGMNGGRVQRCHSSGDVSGVCCVGGLAGGNYDYPLAVPGAWVKMSYSTGSVTGQERVGGLVGENAGPVGDSYATGDVTGELITGGLCGYNGKICWDEHCVDYYLGYVYRSYSTGSVTGDSSLGGLVGWNDEGGVSWSFWDMETSGMTESDGGTGKTTAQMQDITTFLAVEWPIVAVLGGEIDPDYTWNIVDGQTYPFLSWADPSDIPGVQYELTISSWDGGSVMTPGESTFTYDAGTVVSLIAAVEWCNHDFVGWSGDVDTVASIDDPSTTITMNGDYAITAMFGPPPVIGRPDYREVWVCSTDGGSVITPGEGGFGYADGTVVELVAAPTSGYRFVNWSGTVGTIADVNSATTTITVDAHYYVTANFEEDLDNNPPFALVESMSVRPKTMHPGIQYTVTAAYHDPDGMEDLKYCYLRLNHPTKPLTLMWNRATDEFWTWAGELGEDYVTVTGSSVPMYPTGYDLNWHFTLNEDWPEVEDAIDFGLFATDNQGAVSGWEYDDTKASFRLAMLPDFWIDEIKPVQVVWNSDVNNDGRTDLVAGKATMVRVYVGMEDYEGLPEDTPVEVQLTFDGIDYMQSSTISELRTDNGQMDFYPASPIGVGAQTMSAVVDPDNNIREADESNNQDSIDVVVRQTDSLYLYYTAINMPATLIGYGPIDVELYEETADRSGDFVYATYPLAEGQLTNHVATLPWGIGSPYQISGIILDATAIWTEGKLRTLGKADVSTGIVPDDYFTYHLMPNAKGVTVKGVASALVEVGYWTAVAHEVGHVFGLWTDEEQYDVVEPGFRADGFWVQERTEIVNGASFMGYAGAYRSLSHTAKYDYRPIWVADVDYADLFSRFNPGRHGAVEMESDVLLVTGIISREGTVEIGKLYMVEGGMLEHTTPGDYSAQILDADGLILTDIPFHTAFEMNVNPLGIIETDYAAFALTVPYVENTAQLQIQHLGQTLIEINPNTETLRNAVDSIPDQGFVNNPDQRRNALHRRIDAVEGMIERGQLRAAVNVLERSIKDGFQKWLVDDYSVESPLQLSKDEVLRLVESIIDRLRDQLK